MKKRIVGYGLWLLLACCLYFFENNAGTRIVLASSLLLPLIPAIRQGFLSAEDKAGKEQKPQAATLQSFSYQEDEEPGDVRSYLPGDPVNRIHWKLSAKRDELLIREQAKEAAVASSQTEAPDTENEMISKKIRNQYVWWMAAILLLTILLFFLIPEAKNGAEELLNRVFEASEQANAYLYDRFPVDAQQSITVAVLLLSIAAFVFLSLIILSGSRMLALGVMAGCVAFQVYFGLAFPAWINVLLFAFFALWVLVRPWDRKKAVIILALIAAVSLTVIFFLPGTNEAVESASENVRDWLSRTAQQITGTVQETAAGENETRHVHTQSLITGDQEAFPDQEYRLVTVEEEQISMPHWVNYLRIVLLLLLTIALVILPFLPFLVLNARRKKAIETRKAFQSEQISEAVCAIFQHVIAWLEAADYGEGNLPYIQWTEHLRQDVPENYAEQFAQCAAMFEEAAYSDHPLTEEKRLQALKLLEATEEWLLSKADWKQKLRLKYGKCLY